MKKLLTTVFSVATILALVALTACEDIENPAKPLEIDTHTEELEVTKVVEFVDEEELEVTKTVEFVDEVDGCPTVGEDEYKLQERAREIIPIRIKDGFEAEAEARVSEEDRGKDYYYELIERYRSYEENSVFIIDSETVKRRRGDKAGTYYYSMIGVNFKALDQDGQMTQGYAEVPLYDSAGACLIPLQVPQIQWVK